MGMTLTEKILSSTSGEEAYAGDFVIANIDFAMSHDGTSPLTIEAFRRMGKDKVWDPDKIAFVIDHTAPSSSVGASAGHKMMKEFASEHGIGHFYYGEGICHQLMIERGHVKPGTVVVGADSDAVTYGCIGAFATGIGSTEMARVFMEGKLWFKVPETLRIFISGEFPERVTVKDFGLKMIGEIGMGGAAYQSVRYAGPAVKGMDIGKRMTL
ncbi:3-isopropylmalate dehydratase, partial [candidate division MSBL1 archaeon SCGC-AAA259D14]